MPIESYRDYKYYLGAELAGYGLSRWGIRQWLKYPIIRYQRRLRRIEYLLNCKKGLLSKIELVALRWRKRHLGFLLGLQIPPNVCGAGLTIAHYGLIIINSEANIGKNCRIHAGVNIGQWRKKAPKIGDDVYIGPGAKLFGGITVGNKVVVGANAVVCADVPDGVTVAGVPARVISEMDSSTVS